MANNEYQFRMRASGEAVDQDGCVVDAEGVTWCTSDALRRKADRLEAQAAARPERAIFAPAPTDHIADALSEPSVAGGTLDAMHPVLWAKRGGKPGE